MRGLKRKIRRLSPRHSGGECRHYLTLMLRGGRMTKVAGIAASFAPSLGALSTGLGTLMIGSALSVTGAMGGNCVATGGSTYVCSGPAGPGTDTTQGSASVPRPITFSTTAGFGIDTASGDAFQITQAFNFPVQFTDAYSSLISGARHGIFAYAAGSTSVTASGTVSGGTYGVYTRRSIDGASIDITNGYGTASVTGGQTGILVRGDGFVSVTADNAYGTVQDAIYAYADGNYLTVTANGTVTGGRDGIFANNDGNGPTTITASGAQVSGARHGIQVDNAASAGSATVIADTVRSTGTGDAIFVTQQGSGDVVVNSANATGTGSVTSNFRGVYVVNNGSAAASATVDTVTAGAGDGIFINNDAGSTSASVTAYGTVTGSPNAVYVLNYGTGATSITATGATLTGGTNGIRVLAQSSTTDLTVTADNVTGTSGAGIFANSQSYAGTTITTTNATGTGQVTGGQHGIDATHTGNFNLRLNVDNVTGGTGHGILANGIGNSENLYIDVTGTVQGDLDGINALGSLQPFSPTSDAVLSINASNADGTVQVTGGQSGIEVYNSDRGSISVTADNVTGTARNGIYALNSFTSRDLSIRTYGTVTGGLVGIDARNNLNYSSTVNASNADGTGQVTGGVFGISLVGAYGNITADNVTGIANHGIVALNQAGHLSVSTSGLVQGGANGINVSNNGTQDLTVTATNADGTAQVTGGQSGISADNNNGGALTISANNVTGTAADGIYANNDVNGTSVSVTTTGIVTGGDNGIEVQNAGAGAVTINASNASGTGQVTGGQDGILGQNLNGGLSIAVDNVTGTALNGIQAISVSSSTPADQIVTARGTVQGFSAGIRASHRSAGNQTINAYNTEGTALVTSNSSGIRASNYDGGALTINANNVTGTTRYGIFARSGSSTPAALTGPVTITATGAVTGGIAGIDVRSYSQADLTVDVTNAAGTAQVTGGQYGIKARKTGGGNLTISVDNVTDTSGYGISANNYTSGQNVDVTVYGTVTAGADAVRAFNYGMGTTAITATGATVTGGANGIRVTSGADTTGLSITGDNVTGTNGTGIFAVADNSGTTSIDTSNASGTGSVTGGKDGIVVIGGSSTNVITVDGVTGTSGDGIRLTSASNLTLTANGLVQGGQDGIDIQGITYGTVTVNAASVQGGIYGINLDLSGPSDVVVDTTNATGTGLVTGGTTGIRVVKAFSTSGAADGTITITTDDVSGGILASNDANGLDVSVTAQGEVTGGILARSLGMDGAVSVTASDRVTGGIEATDAGLSDLTVNATNATGTAYVEGGIRAFNAGGATTVSADNVSAAGIRALDVANTNGTGTSTALTINLNGTIDGGTVVYADNAGSGDLTINAGSATLTGTADGIYTRNSIGGDLRITANSVNTTGGTGITAQNTSMGSVIIDATNAAGTGQVTGAVSGITVDNNNGGAVTITANHVTGTAVDGIYVSNDTAGGAVSVTTTGTVMGGDEGIEVQNEGMGGVTVNATNASGTGQVTSTNSGIRVENENGGAVSITADNVTSGAVGNGIFADNDENGTSTSIRTYGTIYAGNFGIRAFTQGTGDLTIDTSNATAPTSVTGGRSGVSAENLRGGALTITTDNVYGGSTSGISADNTAGTTTLTINARGTTQSDRFGIRAGNQGSGDVTVNAYNAAGTALVLGEYQGISAGNRNGGAVIVTTNAVTGTTSKGIGAYNDASGTSVSITALGSVSGGADGIDVLNNGTEGITIDATNAAGNNQVTGGTYGIFADNNNGGDISITANNVTGTTADGINANNDLFGGSLSVSATGTVIGGEDGIEAVNTGSGSVTVTASNADGTAQVTGGNRGIAATSRSGDMTVTANTVTGNNGQGIRAYSYLGGAVSVTANGNITGTTQGIEAVSRSFTGGVTVDATNATGTNQVTGGVSGIVADADIGGAVSVAANNVTGTAQYGIRARTQGGDVTVSSTGTVIGGTIGVYAVKSAGASNSGTLTVDASNADGTGQVMGGTTGIFARNMGGSTIVIADNVTGTSQFGISADATDLTTSQDLTVTARGVVQGGSIGIRSTLYSAGNHTINAYNAAGTASVTGGIGISATSRSSTGALTITTNAVTGTNLAGIFVDDRTISGSTTINASGPVSGFRDGININSISRGDVSVDATNMAGTNTVTGGQYGIFVSSSNGGTLAIRANNVE
ncbi:MAG: hypothetical protein AAF382_12335, partial [Pseudomonadota bacterium]